MSTKQYIPRQDAQFIEWAKYMYNYAAANCERWKVMPPDNSLWELITAFELSLQKAAAPNHGKIDTLEKNEARKALEKECRIYVQGFLAKNPFVTNVDRENMKITIYDVNPTSVPDPTGQAEADVTYPGRTQLQLHIKHIDGTPSDGKAAYGFRVYYGIFAHGEAPVSGKDLHESRFSRQKKVLFTFEPEDSGKTAFFAIRYENSKGKTGPWGPVFSAVIP